ncbi:hypothetical protein DL96DRAFT_1714940 [Flagelloscypha sp. PMI_526]|nr:hypothetical protein DL96DRAFT_1714940 [Flagelloscypha sp. PMI_526]
MNPVDAIRETSPTSSVGTTYPEDQTSLEDLEENCTHDQFEAKCRDLIGLDNPLDPHEAELEENPRYPLLPPIPETEPERTCKYLAFQQNLESLRQVVKDLEADDMFEEVKFQGSRVGLADEPVTHDIDSILFGMLDMPVPGMLKEATKEPQSFGANALESMTTVGGGTGQKAGVFKGRVRRA